MSSPSIAKELGFVADLVGLINNNFEDIHKETRSEMMILAVERLERIRQDMAESKGGSN
jgi:hypothetical protein